MYNFCPSGIRPTGFRLTVFRPSGFRPSVLLPSLLVMYDIGKLYNNRARLVQCEHIAFSEYLAGNVIIFRSAFSNK